MQKRNGTRLTREEIGRLGEELAVSWLRKEEKVKVLQRNFRAPGGGEVDIIARQAKLLLFIEVKTRTSTAMGRPLSAVGNKKRKLIRRGGNAWLRQLGGKRNFPWRYDVVEVLLQDGERPEINWVQGIAPKRPW